MNSYFVLCSVPGTLEIQWRIRKKSAPKRLVVNYQREGTCVGSSETRQPSAKTGDAMSSPWLDDLRKSP